MNATTVIAVGIVSAAWLADQTTARVIAYRTSKRRDEARAAAAKAGAS